MKKIFALGLVALLLAPAFALADSAVPIGQSLLQLVTALASVEAQEAALQSGAPLACAAAFSATTVEVGQPVALGWGSVGAMSPGDDPAKSVLTPNGGEILAIDKAGNWKYTLAFYSASGASTTCSAFITVMQ